MMASANDGVRCFCQSHDCRGKVVSLRTVKRHANEDHARIKEKKTHDGSASTLECKTFHVSDYENHVLATTPLYENATLSVLGYIFMIMRTFVAHPNHTKESVDEVLRNDRQFKLPQPNSVPTSFSNAKGLLRDFLSPLINYHVCRNDCIVYRGCYSDYDHCPRCGVSRFVGETRNAAKSFKYFPLGPRIARTFLTTNLVQLLKAHASPTDGVLRDIWDTSRWRGSWYGKDGLFDGDATGIALSFCSDGVNPFKTMHHIYSMWPLVVSVLNFPPALRKAVGGIQLLGIIPGNGKREPYHLDPYIDILVDELLELSDCHIHNPEIVGEPMRVKVRLLQAILDFPGQAKIFKQPASGALMACPWCRIVGNHSRVLCKTVYLQNRRFLRSDHVLRNANPQYISGVEKRPAPSSYSSNEERNLRKDYDLLPNENQRKAFARKHGVKGQYSFMRLPYHDFHSHYQPDAMHTIKDTVEHIISWLSGKKINIQMDGADREFFQQPPRQLNWNKNQPLTAEEKSRANLRCRSLRFPKGFCGYTGNLFDAHQEVLKKTHGYTEYVANNIISYLLRDCLQERQRRSLIYFFVTLAKLHDRSFSDSSLNVLESEVGEAISLLERDCPVWLFNITTHILHHLVQGIRNNGPLPSSWMYPFERMNCWLTRRANSRKHPEATIMETYQILDWVIYAIMSNKFDDLEDPSNNVQKTICRTLVQHGFVASEEHPEVHPSAEFTDAEKDSLSCVVDCDTISQLRRCTVLTVEDSSYSHLYSAGDCVYNSSEDCFALIEGLYSGNGTEVAAVRLYDNCETDHETGIRYAPRETSASNMAFFKLHSLSAPLVTADEGGHTWFVSKKPDSFSWFDDHLKS